MAPRKAFTGGVRPGGLTNCTEIHLLLCYLIQNAGPITKEEIETALMEEELVNYFEIGSGLEDILRQELVVLEDGCYSITDKGRGVSRELADNLPRTVRERAIAAVLKAQLWNRKQAEYSADITERPDGRYSVCCNINRLDDEMFTLVLEMPDKITAEHVKKRFILRGNEIYQLLINKLTDDNS